jgi:hypothetical protein
MFSVLFTVPFQRRELRTVGHFEAFAPLLGTGLN